MVKRPSIQASFITHLIVTYLLLGISIVTQFISYPLFNVVSESLFESYHTEYLTQITVIVLPLIVIEFLTGLYLLLEVGDFRIHSLLRSGFALILTILVLTLMFELPSQFILLNGFSQKSYSTILFANFVRMIFWILRAVLVTKMIKYFFSYDTAYAYEEFT